jgi:hypothetical protein
MLHVCDILAVSCLPSTFCCLLFALCCLISALCCLPSTTHHHTCVCFHKHMSPPSPSPIPLHRSVTPHICCRLVTPKPSLYNIITVTLSPSTEYQNNVPTFTVVTLLSRRCYTVVTLLLHRCYTVVTLLSLSLHCCQAEYQYNVPSFTKWVLEQVRLSLRSTITVHILLLLLDLIHPSNPDPPNAADPIHPPNRTTGRLSTTTARCYVFW